MVFGSELQTVVLCLFFLKIRGEKGKEVGTCKKILLQNHKK